MRLWFSGHKRHNFWIIKKEEKLSQLYFFLLIKKLPIEVNQLQKQTSKEGLWSRRHFFFWRETSYSPIHFYWNHRKNRNFKNWRHCRAPIMRRSNFWFGGRQTGAIGATDPASNYWRQPRYRSLCIFVFFLLRPHIRIHRFRCVLFLGTFL